MKVVLYMAVTANGMIAGENDDVSWVSKASWKSYTAAVKRADVVLVGRRTYELMPASEFTKEKPYVVFTRREWRKKTPFVRFTQDSPRDVLRDLNQEGLKKACLIGGAMLNTALLEAGLIDHVYVDVHPLMLARGTPIFNGNRSNVQLILIGSKKLKDSVVQLHYKVNKQRSNV